jgi:hypothetical protein
MSPRAVNDIQKTLRCIASIVPDSVMMRLRCFHGDLRALEPGSARNAAVSARYADLAMVKLIRIPPATTGPHGQYVYSLRTLPVFRTCEQFRQPLRALRVMAYNDKSDDRSFGERRSLTRRIFL